MYFKNILRAKLIANFSLKDILLHNLTMKSLRYLVTCLNYQRNKEITHCRQVIFFLLENIIDVYPLSNSKIS